MISRNRNIHICSGLVTHPTIITIFEIPQQSFEWFNSTNVKHFGTVAHESLKQQHLQFDL